MADEHPLLRGAVTTALNADEGFDVVGEAALGSDLQSITQSAEPDVVLVILRSPGVDGFRWLSRLRGCCPDVKVIVCALSAELDHIETAFRLGACGFVLLTGDPADLAAAVRRVVGGTAYHTSRTPTIDQDDLPQTGLTPQDP